MAEEWLNNDSARVMTRKYNNGVKELNNIVRTALSINDRYVTTIPSEFDLSGDKPEGKEE